MNLRGIERVKAMILRANEGVIEDRMMPENRRPPQPSFGEALRFWSKLGWISFGGTAGHIAIMHDELVDRRRWISNGKFLHALSHCMILPGPEAQQLAIYIGWQLHGKKGGLAAGTLFVLPSMFILLGLSVVYVSYGELPWIRAMFEGLKPAVIALVILALIKISRRALRGPLAIGVAVAAFVAMGVYQVSLLWAMGGAIVLALVIGWLRPSWFAHGVTESQSDAEDGYHLNRHSRGAETETGPKRALGLVAVGVALWLAPLVLLYFLSGDFPFWQSLVLFFTKTAFVTIGGSYTVIPYVAQLSVLKLKWLSAMQMTDGFALAETTPGPLIIVLAFVGFMAGYNHFHGSLWMGAVGLFATTFYTFLPCFLFVFAGAPVVEKTQGKPAVEGVLKLVTAVVVGAILNLAIFLGKGVVFPGGVVTAGGIDWIAMGWVVVTLALMTKAKVHVIVLVGLSVLFGLGRYWAGR
jgi:chromate transporter